MSLRTSPETPPGSFVHSILWLWQAGLRFGGVIDLGCADGHFSLMFKEFGPFRDSVLLNVDAQADYRESLDAIKSVVGGHWRQCAVAEIDGGEIELTRGAHAYWSSLRPAGDAYWRAINDLRGEVARVPRRTIDSLVAETKLPGPYLIKMDVQGGERAALAGAARTLAETDVVVAETALDDFSGIHQALDGAGFDLFDLTQITYTDTRTLGWFYPVYLNRRRAAVKVARWWSPHSNAGVVNAQVQRRAAIQAELSAMLQRFRAAGWPRG
jgi:FkbM family methyltransferase